MKKTFSINAKLSASPYIVWMLIFIFAPLIMVVYYAFTDASGNFTMNNIIMLDNYISICTD